MRRLGGSRLHSCILIFPLLVALGACGGDSDEGEPLLSGSLTAEYDGNAFTPVNGFATTSDGIGLIVLGDGPVRCGSEDDTEPPAGRNAAVTLPALEVGSHTSVFVQMFQNVGDFEGVGSNQGTLELTSVSQEAVAGSISFDYVDDEGRQFRLDGDFEVVRCAP
ncbi:MAG TPA: hypothetical protein VKZ63_16245 [Kofleriaceae bacterium]|nr:hypothetical protein [Kofleriaceae bacterium]